MAKKQKYLIFLSVISLLFLNINFCLAAYNFEVNLVPFGLKANPTLPDYIKYAFEEGAAIGGVIAVLGVVFAGFVYVFSGGSDEKMRTAKQIAISSVVGVVLLFGSYIVIQSINPQLNTFVIQNPQTFGGLFLTGSGPNQPAPASANNAIDFLSGGYTNIKWIGDSNNICDSDNPNAVYVVYFFNSINFKDVNSTPVRLKCGQQTAIQGASWTIRKESPGIYLYPGTDCTVANDVLPTQITAGVKNLNGTIGSIRIVNGTDQFAGPFYGAIIFDSTDYTGYFISYPYSSQYETSRCLNVNTGVATALQTTIAAFTPKSVVAYQWSGKDKNNPVTNAAGAGSGITLWTKPNFTGGFNKINDSTITDLTLPQNKNNNYIWTADLKERSPNYTNSNIPPAVQQDCQTFGTTSNPILGSAGFVTKCLQSIQIDGNYLVVLYRKGLGNGGTSIYNYGQRFPISSALASVIQKTNTSYDASKGSLNLNLDWLYSYNGFADSIMIIPLAQSLSD